MAIERCWIPKNIEPWPLSTRTNTTIFTVSSPSFLRKFLGWWRWLIGDMFSKVTSYWYLCIERYVHILYVYVCVCIYLDIYVCVRTEREWDSSTFSSSLYDTICHIRNDSSRKKKHRAKEPAWNATAVVQRTRSLCILRSSRRSCGSQIVDPKC